MAAFVPFSPSSSSATRPVTRLFIQLLLFCFLVPFASGAVCEHVDGSALSTSGCTCGNVECTTTRSIISGLVRILNIF